MLIKTLTTSSLLLAFTATAQQTFYTETFDSSLNGWSMVNIQGDLDWTWTNTGPGYDGGLFPVPDLNTSTPSGWAIIDDDLYGESGVVTNAALVSPVIDLSAASPHLKLVFDQYIQAIVVKADQTFVGVSTDGLTWAEIELNDFIGRAGRPNPELMEVDISSWVAADPANVRLRFRYEAEWYYGWQIDNIRIVELPDNDLRIVKVKTTDFDFGTGDFEHLPYKVYPEAQLCPLQLGVTVVNMGHILQTGVQFNVEVSGPVGVEYTNSLLLGTSSQGDVLEPWITSYVPSGGPGMYTVTYTITQDQIDQLPLNNVSTAIFEVSPNLWSGTRGPLEDKVSGTAHPTEQWEMGYAFEVTNSGSQLEAVQVALATSTTVGALIYGIVYDDNQQLVDVTADHTIQANELNGYGGSNYVTLAFDAPVPMIASTWYFVMVGRYAGSDVIRVGSNGLSPADFARVFFPDLGFADDLIYDAPMVRAVLDDEVGMSEVESPVGSVTCTPNPFSTTSEVCFAVRTSTTVHAQLHDALGRLVRSEALGTLGAGEHRWTIDSDGLSDGVYQFSIVTGDQRRSGRVVLEHQ